MKRKTMAVATIAVALGLAFNVRVATLDTSGWGVDFNQFFSAGKLIGTGHLYDWEALRKLEAEHGPDVPTGRLPVVLYGYKILGGFSYRAAQSICMALGVAALVALAFTWPDAGLAPMLIAVAWSMPASLVILFGQDTPFWLLFFAAGLLLMQRKRPYSAGMTFALCLCKFHLALGIPVMLAAQKRWKTMFAGAGAVLFLIGVCFAIDGPDWPMRYWKMTHMAAFPPSPEVMPTIAGLVGQLGLPAAMEFAAAAAVLVLLWVACQRAASPGIAGAAAAACGLLVAHHALYSDTVLLLPLGVLTIGQESVPAWLKGWAVLMLSPLPFLLGSQLHHPLLWQALITPFVIVAVLAAAKRSRDDVVDYVPGYVG